MRKGVRAKNRSCQKTATVKNQQHPTSRLCEKKYQALNSTHLVSDDLLSVGMLHRAMSIPSVAMLLDKNFLSTLSFFD